jgi:hypothetical protein
MHQSTTTHCAIFQRRQQHHAKQRAHLLFCVGAAFSSSITSAADPQDVAAAHSRVYLGVFAMAGLLGKRMQPFQVLPGNSSSNSSSSPEQHAALRRMQQRAQHAGVDAFDLLVNVDL